MVAFHPGFARRGGPAPRHDAPPRAGLRLAQAADGALEIRSGADLVARVPLKTPALRRGQPTLREVTVEGHRVAELRVPVRGASGAEVWLGEAGRAPITGTIWAGLTGARDADGETSIWVEATPERVIEYQTAAQVNRCDGAPPRLFPRAYDFAAGRFRPIVSPIPAPAPTTLVARRGDPAMPAGRPLADFHFVGASTTRGAGADARGADRAAGAGRREPGDVVGRGAGWRRARRISDRPRRGHRVRRSRLAHLPGRRRQPGGAARAQPREEAAGRVRAGARAAVRRRDRRRSGRHRGALARSLLGRLPEAGRVRLPHGHNHGGDAGDGGLPASAATARRPSASWRCSRMPTVPAAPSDWSRTLAGAPDCATRLPLLLGLGNAALLPTAQAVATSSGPRACLSAGGADPPRARAQDPGGRWTRWWPRSWGRPRKKRASSRLPCRTRRRRRWRRWPPCWLEVRRRR